MQGVKTDITDRNDLEKLLVAFYEKALADTSIGRFFTEVVPLDMAKHIPVITDFWEGVVFNKNSYKKKVMAIHQQINELSPIRKDHLDRWLKLFTETVDETFAGSNAELTKQRAKSVAMLMDIKLNYKNLSK